MSGEITIKRKHNRGDDGCKVISVRMSNELIKDLDDLSKATNHSRNDLINKLLISALKIVKIED